MQRVSLLVPLVRWLFFLKSTTYRPDYVLDIDTICMRQ